MKTQQAIDLAGSTKGVAVLLGITSGAVSQWGESVPDNRVWQLRVLRPNWFERQDGDADPIVTDGCNRRARPFERRVSVRSIAARAEKPEPVNRQARANCEPVNDGPAPKAVGSPSTDGPGREGLEHAFAAAFKAGLIVDRRNKPRRVADGKPSKQSGRREF